MPTRRIEDRIKDLCERLLKATEPEWSIIVRELQLALHEHTLRMANVTAAVVVAGRTVEERRRNREDSAKSGLASLKITSPSAWKP